MPTQWASSVVAPTLALQRCSAGHRPRQSHPRPLFLPLQRQCLHRTRGSVDGAARSGTAEQGRQPRQRLAVLHSIISGGLHRRRHRPDARFFGPVAFHGCPDSCPLETARLAKAQKILGDRVGQDIFMYSITIDPENDTPEVLAKYAERYRAQPGWWFLTGKEADITLLRQKLGLYMEEIQDGSNNHNLSLIIGNQATGQWMRRSPFENPYVLATQIGSWLSGWKAPAEAAPDYATAPKVRNISQGEQLFRTRCATCHTIGRGEEGLAPGLIGPDLLEVAKRRERAWLERWLAVPDQMLAEGDPIALGPMPSTTMYRCSTCA